MKVNDYLQSLTNINFTNQNLTLHPRLGTDHRPENCVLYNIHTLRDKFPSLLLVINVRNLLL